MVCSCAGGRKVKANQYDCNQKVAEAIDLYNSKKYAKVKTLLSDVKMQCGGTSIMDTVLFYAGMANMKMKQYIEARSEFGHLVSDFPNSPLSEEAQFRAGLSVYLQSHSSSRDQTETREAIRMFRDFIDVFPNSPVVDSVSFYLDDAINKLAEKEFNNARFYDKNREYEAAVVYYKAFVQQFPDSKYSDLSRLNMAEMLIRLDRRSEAQDALQELMQYGKDKGILAKAKQLYSRTGPVEKGSEDAGDQN